MTPETWTIIGTGIALAVLNIGLFAWLRADVRDLRQQTRQVIGELWVSPSLPTPARSMVLRFGTRATPCVDASLP